MHTSDGADWKTKEKKKLTACPTVFETNKTSGYFQGCDSKLNDTLFPGVRRLLSSESIESPSSFFMSSSSLSRLTPPTTLNDASGTTASAALDLDLTPTCGPCGDVAAETAAAVLLLLRATAVLLLRKRFPLRLWSLLDCAECCTGASRDWAAKGGGETPKSEVKFSAGFAACPACCRLRMRLSIWASRLRAAVWEPRREDEAFLSRGGERWREKHKY